MVSVGMAGWWGRLALALVVFLVSFGLLRWMRNGGRKTWRELWELLNGSLRRKIIAFAIAVSVVFVLGVMAPLMRFEPDVTAGLEIALNAAWIFAIAWGLTLLTSVVVCFVQWRYDIEVVDNLGARQMHTKVKVLRRIAVVLIWFGAVAGSLLLFERFRVLGGTLLASAGVLSIALGISAQKTFGAVIAGIQIALTHPINLDDVVIIEGEWGRIEEITFTYVVVKIWDQRRLIVPVTYFLEKPFQNWTKTSSEIIGTIFLYVDYATPLAPIRDELKRLCESSGSLWNGKTCVLQVTDAGTESMTLRALVSSPNASSAWDLRCLVREGLIDFIRLNYPECLPKQRLLLQDGDAVYSSTTVAGE